MPGAAPPGRSEADARNRLPTEPYPGLRPFLDFEEILLFGRERQVREVIERLKETQFVAVIGGSGSGKSSLVLAGVVPELRSFGIPGAGDFWVPLVCTPGTNATPADQRQRVDTPITRLARKFAALLRPCATPELEEARRADIAARLREERGLSRIVRQYSAELAAPPGPDPQEARFLFVIDQFEELFHPTTRNVEDARLLVERVIDHFFSPHERCYVVLTMRSEHLADCAGFLELPDAINKASYLVRRLDEAELASAITGPAGRLLRLKQRAEVEGERLPDEVRFDDDVVARLLRDVQAIADDSDHLPLLQHALARTWQAAVQRVRERLDFPDRIVGTDLAVAAGAPPGGGAPALADDANLLRASLENWAEACYRTHDEAGQRQLDAVLRRLAVKDPNTGMYSQQRLGVDEGVRLLGSGATREQLRALLAQGFLGDVDYLYWDKENPQRITIKVSHESFIRGWSRLRGLIDHEAERYAEFVELLRKCEDWKREGGTDELLLEGAELRRTREAELEEVLAAPEERAAWFRRLEATRAYAHLRELEPEVARYVESSKARQQERLDSERGRHRRNVLFGAAALFLLPLVAFGILVQGPVIARTSLMFRAGSIAGATPLLQAQPGVGSETRPLSQLLEAAEMMDRGRWGGDGVLATLNRLVLDHFGSMPFVRGQAQFVEQVAANAEPVVNGGLRQLLTGALWATSARAVSDSKRTVDLASYAGAVECRVERVGGNMTPERGRLYTAHNDRDRRLSRSIFVPDPTGERWGEVELRAAALAPDDRACAESRQELIRIPRFLDPQIAFDANLRHVFYAGGEPGARSVTVSEVDWELTDDEGGRSVRKLPRMVLTGQPDVAALVAAIGASPEAVVPLNVLATARLPAGRAILVGERGWRLFDETAQRISDEENDERLRPLADAPADSACEKLRVVLDQRKQDGFQVRMLEDAGDAAHCFAVTWGQPPTARKRSDQVVVAVYPRPSQATMAAGEWPAPIASLPRFTRVRAGEPVRWRVGLPGTEFAGWIAAWSLNNTGEQRYVAAPWSTCALWRLGREVLAEQPREASAETPARRDEICLGR